MILLKYFSNKFTLQVCIFGSNLQEDPGGVMVIKVDLCEYPIPPLIILTEVIAPFWTIGVIDAPDPLPVIEILGEE